MNDFPLKKFTEKKKVSESFQKEKKRFLCNRCDQEIIWKYSYKEYLEKKKEDPEFKNIPLNPDGTPHICQTEKKEQEEEKEYSIICPHCNQQIKLSVK